MRYIQTLYLNVLMLNLQKGEMDNLLFMNEPITLRQIGSLFKILPSEFTTVFTWKVYTGFWGPVFTRREVRRAIGHVRGCRC